MFGAAQTFLSAIVPAVDKGLMPESCLDGDHLWYAQIQGAENTCMHCGAKEPYNVGGRKNG